MTFFRIFRRAIKDEDGGPTVEFVILFPLFIALVISGVEAGWLMTRFVMVERGVDIAMRDVRLGNLQNPTYEDLRDRICDRVKVIEDCSNNLVLTTQVVDTDNGDTVDTDPAPCFDRTATAEELESYDPADGHSTGGSAQIVVIKVCAIIDPIFKKLGLSAYLPLDDSGGYHIRTTNAFMNEPYSSDGTS